MIKVVIAGFDGALSSAITGVLDLFSMAGVSWNRIQKQQIRRLFSVQIASHLMQPIKCINGLQIQPQLAFSELENVDVLVIPTIGAVIEEVLANNPKLIELIQKANQEKWTIAGNCTGNFFLAEAGILAGKCATTHWGFKENFLSHYPDVTLYTDQLITRAEHIYCAGGGLAWFDLGLHLIERFYGFEVAIESAKSFVLDYRRDSQLSYSLLNLSKPHHDELIQKIQKWIALHYHQDFTLEHLAEQFSVTTRTLIRRFKACLDIPPNAYIQAIRIEAAQKQLEETEQSIDVIMQSVGYHDPSSFRRLFRKKTGLTPLEYRRRFSRRF